MPYLYVLNGAQRHRVFQIDGDEPVVVGKADGARVRLTDPWISWEHARIVRDGASYAIEDMGSRNGTYVNCDRVTKRTLVEDDVLFLGRTHVLVVLSDRAPSAPPVPQHDPRRDVPTMSRAKDGEITMTFRSPFSDAGPIEELEIPADEALIALPPAATVFSSSSSQSGDDHIGAIESRGDLLSDDHIEIDIEELGLAPPPSRPSTRSSSRDRDDEIEHLRSELATKDAEISRLREELTRLREQYLDL